MAVNSRFLSIPYILNSLRIKCKGMFLTLTRRQRPFEYFDNVGSCDLPDYQFNYNSKYESLSYFDYNKALSYYSNSDALISRVIEALCHYNDNGGGDDFMCLVTNIRDQITDEGDYIFYRYPKAYGKFGAKEGYISGILQAKLTSLFIRAYESTSDQSYIEYAKKCLNACCSESIHNGPYRYTSEDIIWVEEYPSISPTMVLNGQIYVLIALAEYLSFKDSIPFLQLFEGCLRTTLQYLPKYKVGNDLLYSMHTWDLCNEHYLAIMIYQFQHLYKLSRIKAFLDFSSFLKDQTNWKVFKAMIN